MRRMPFYLTEGFRDFFWVLLLPLSLLWGVFAAWRGGRARRPIAGHRDLFVVCVGGVQAGGSGKTPLVQAIVKHLGAESAAIVMRGYRGLCKNSSQELNRNSENGAEYYGDEAWMMAALTQARIWVGKRRNQSLHSIAAQRIRLAVCDDGLQSPGFHKDLKIAVVSDPQFAREGFLIPLGNFRASPAALRHCDAVVVTRHSDDAQSICLNVPVFHAERKFGGLWAGPERNQSQKKALAFCGVGSPHFFENDLTEFCPDAILVRTFVNHARYDATDASWLRREAARHGVTRLVTTDKDWVKIEPLLEGSGLEVMSLRIEYELPAAFWRFLNERLPA